MNLRVFLNHKNFFNYSLIFLIFIGTLQFVFADGSDGPPKDTALQIPFTLKIGESASIDSILHVSFLNVTEDSRCPADVTCVWQGTASISVKVRNNDNDFGFNTVPLGDTGSISPRNFDGYFIRMIHLEPYPNSTKQITSSDYIATLIVGKINNSSILSPLKQFKDGIPFFQIQCKPGLQLTQKYDESPACVKPSTYFELIKRDWTSNIIKAIQSRGVSEINN